MAQSRTHRMTNTEFVTQIMEFAKSGPLMQAFIIEALSYYSKMVAEMPVEKIGGGAFMNPHAWKACGEELHREIEARYAS